MQIVGEHALRMALSALPGVPRVVCSGNFATPWYLVNLLDQSLPRFRLHILNAQPGVPDRDGVELETSFVGPGMRHSQRLRYIPCRLSLLPRLLATTLPPDVVLLHTSAPRGERSRWAPR